MQLQKSWRDTAAGCCQAHKLLCSYPTAEGIYSLCQQQSGYTIHFYSPPDGKYDQYGFKLQQVASASEVLKPRRMRMASAGALSGWQLLLGWDRWPRPWAPHRLCGCLIQHIHDDPAGNTAPQSTTV